MNEITVKIIGCAYKVSNTLGIGYVEKVCENALAVLSRKSGLLIEQQYPIKVIFEGVDVGEFFADPSVEERILVELKAVSMLAQKHTAQALNYLRATGAKVCLLINFGRSKIEIKRLLPSVYWKTLKS
ncbi:MAG: GxxExxY protein [Anaerolineales bacterium]|nr:GxxExxY protein [Anaerolineales bacterium]